MRTPNTNMRSLLSSVTARSTLTNSGYTYIRLYTGDTVLSDLERAAALLDPVGEFISSTFETELLKTRTNIYSGYSTSMRKSLDKDTSAILWPSSTLTEATSQPIGDKPIGIALIMIGLNQFTTMRNYIVLSLGYTGSGCEMEISPDFKELGSTLSLSDFLITLK